MTSAVHRRLAFLFFIFTFIGSCLRCMMTAFCRGAGTRSGRLSILFTAPSLCGPPPPTLLCSSRETTTALPRLTPRLSASGQASSSLRVPSAPRRDRPGSRRPCSGRGWCGGRATSRAGASVPPALLPACLRGRSTNDTPPRECGRPGPRTQARVGRVHLRGSPRTPGPPACGNSAPSLPAPGAYCAGARPNLDPGTRVLN